MKLLIVVDGQNDFISGTLPVPGGEEIVPIINSIKDKFYRTLWTQDWHPSDHSSFKINGGIWPVHCVQESTGARLHEDFDIDIEKDLFVVKGTDTSIDSYSGFYDNNREKATDLVADLIEFTRQLKVLMMGENGKPKLYICGLATEYCVKATVMDALKEGYETYIILDACRGINKEDMAKAQEEMVDAGALITSSKAILGGHL